MSAYGEFKNRNYIYVAYLHLKGRGLVDLVERHDLLQGVEAYENLVELANLDTFGEGIYEVSLNKEWFDDEGRFINGKILKKIIIDRGDEL